MRVFEEGYKSFPRSVARSDAPENARDPVERGARQHVQRCLALLVDGPEFLDLSQVAFGLHGIDLAERLVASAVSLAALSIRTVPESLGWFVAASVVAASVVAAFTYGMIGALAGLVLSRLAVVYVMLFGPMIDVFFFRNPLVTDTHWMAAYLPGHYVTEVAVDAGFSGSVALEALAAALTALASYRSVRVGWVDPDVFITW